jgi:hypothetical protein
MKGFLIALRVVRISSIVVIMIGLTNLTLETLLAKGYPTFDTFLHLGMTLPAAVCAIVNASSILILSSVATIILKSVNQRRP